MVSQAKFGGLASPQRKLPLHTVVRGERGEATLLRGLALISRRRS